MQRYLAAGRLVFPSQPECAEGTSGDFCLCAAASSGCLPAPGMSSFLPFQAARLQLMAFICMNVWNPPFPPLVRADNWLVDQGSDPSQHNGLSPFGKVCKAYLLIFNPKWVTDKSLKHVYYPYIWLISSLWQKQWNITHSWLKPFWQLFLSNENIWPYCFSYQQLIVEMNRLGMLIDLAHVTVQVMNQVLDISEAPVIFSHSSAYSVCKHKRNVPDDVLLRVVSQRSANAHLSSRATMNQS